MNMTLTVSGNGEEDEDFIDIEVISSSSSSSSSSCSSYFSSMTSPSNPREFEFQMSSNSTDKESTPSPADELFYKGNLLPLHLPPRLQMVQKLLQTSPSTSFTLTTTAIASTPLDSCSNSPTSCRELNSSELHYECSSQTIIQSSIGLKLKTYIKSLFNKPDCFEKIGEEGVVSKAKECLNKYMKMVRRNPFKQIHSEGCQLNENLVSGSSSHRRSFSLSIKKNSSISTSSSSSSSTSSSSSSSVNSHGFFELHLLKRSNSTGSEVERSVEGAIAYCKQSQKICEFASSSISKRI